MIFKLKYPRAIFLMFIFIGFLCGLNFFNRYMREGWSVLSVIEFVLFVSGTLCILTTFTMKSHYTIDKTGITVESTFMKPKHLPYENFTGETEVIGGVVRLYGNNKKGKRALKLLMFLESGGMANAFVAEFLKFKQMA